ncbi:hypothetical protein DB30_06961 [Enhygromyxa salina]|uniref:CheW-like domain-containing protein n=1 Tax=Enhygromyxa salina TaxID=215803 RepID=A0A0C2D254_9BACT|nr:hypothetical protein [Enhygromyxa salina]KIG14212.1 hypothetical protein DB30_06961 [Enhygromyxa salina]
MGEPAPERALMRLLVLEGAGLAIPDSVIASIEPGSRIGPGADRGAPWLADLVHGQKLTPTPTSSSEPVRRTLQLQGGGAVEVPATMHIVDHVELLELSNLLRPHDASGAILGVIELPEGLSLVCDPRRLLAQGAPDR